MKNLVFLVLLLSGCSTVLMQEPFPNTPLSESEQEELSGAWGIVNENNRSDFTDIYHVAFTSNGIPQLAVVEWEEDAFELLSFPIYMTKTKDRYFLSIPEDPEDENQVYLFIEFKPSSQGIILWLPNNDVFEGLVESGALEGRFKDNKKKNNLLLTSPATNILDKITTEKDAFDYKEPILLQRL